MCSCRRHWNPIRLCTCSCPHNWPRSDDATGLTAACPAKHPETGNGCTEAAGHEGLHRAMGVVRVQLFGEEAQASS